jgi:hypothetical protein
LQQPNSNPPPPAEVKKATAGFALSLIAGFLVLIEGALLIVRGELDILGLRQVQHRILAGLISRHVGVIAIVFAVIIIIGAILIFMPGKEMVGGIIVLIFSLLSIVTGGGFLVGLILGVIGGILGLMKK